MFNLVVEETNLDNSVLASAVHNFLDRIVTLWEDEQCWTSGYTEHMIKLLVRGNMQIVAPGIEPRCLGGSNSVTACLKNEVRQILLNWVELARHTLRAELPEFEVVYAMRVLHLPDGTKTRVTGVDQSSNAKLASLKTLASFTKVDVQKLRQEYEKLQPLASRLRQTDPSVTSTYEAWKRALLETKTCRHSFPVAALRPVLMLFCCYGPSTSGVERSFAEIRGRAGQSRPRWSSAITDELVIRQSTWSKDSLSMWEAMSVKVLGMTLFDVPSCIQFVNA
eukprot:6463156-Amphidinium_carterae.2